MAIKGKKRKGGSSARRVAGAPRAIHRPAQTRPWYAGRGFRFGVIAALVVAAIVILFVVDSARDRADSLERRQAGVVEFSGEVQALLQRISGPASEMVTATIDSKTLAEDAKRWRKVLTEAQTEMAATTAAAPPQVDTENRLLFQAVLQYIAAAETYALIPKVDSKLQPDVLERAAAQVAAADGTWMAGVAVLDDTRSEIELDPSGLRAPSEVAPAPAPSPSPPGG